MKKNIYFLILFLGVMLRISLPKQTMAVAATGGTVTTEGSYTVHTFTTTGTITFSSGGSVTVHAVGGGGGGGGSNSTNGYCGSGGAGGSYASSDLTVSAQAYTVTVGTGGSAGTSTTNGDIGNPSWFSTSGTIYAEGGARGLKGASTPPSGGAGSTATTIGTIEYAGGNGGTPINWSKSGAGGGGAGTGGVGGNATNGTKGTGTATYGGDGGGTGPVDSAGRIGSAYGGGGSGGNRATVSQVGGAGGDGVVVIKYLTNSANGVSCVAGSECTSTYCADSVCCNTACTGTSCQACNSNSNAGAGTCGYVNTATDPFSDCAGLACSSGSPKYYFGWASNICYYEADISAANAVCTGTSAACQTDANQCPSSTQGGSAGVTRTTCTAQNNCTGTTVGSLTNVADATDTYNDCPAYGCSSTVVGWSGLNCTAYAPTTKDGDCNGSGACYTLFSDSCTATGATTIASCGSAACVNTSALVCHTGDPSTSWDTPAEICLTNGETTNGVATCQNGLYCDGTGTCNPPPDCSSLPLTGNFVITGSACALPGTVNGIDSGTGNSNTAQLTIGAGGSLSVVDGQTLGVGKLVLSGGGTIVLIGNGSIKVGQHLYLPDSDNDKYPDSNSLTTQYLTSGDFKAPRTNADTVDCAPADITKWQNLTAYVDTDGDGYTTNSTTQVCSGVSLPGGYSATPSGQLDCNDSLTDNQYTLNASYYTNTDGDAYTAISSTSAGTARCSTASTWDAATQVSVSGVASNNATFSAGARKDSAGTDCYDSNANAYPGSTYCGGDRGDASYDYNCDGSSSKTGCLTLNYNQGATTNDHLQCIGSGSNMCGSQMLTYTKYSAITTGCGQAGSTCSHTALHGRSCADNPGGTNCSWSGGSTTCDTAANVGNQTCN